MNVYSKKCEIIQNKKLCIIKVVTAKRNLDNKKRLNKFKRIA